MANTVAGLGSQRLIPKIIGALERWGPARSGQLFLTVLLLRVVAICTVSALLFYAYLRGIDTSLPISSRYAVPFIYAALTMSIYVDVEAASQTLRQQRLSRTVALSDVAGRCIGVVTLYAVTGRVTAMALILIIGSTQFVASAVLFLTTMRELRRRALPDNPSTANTRELLHLAFAAYVGGLAWVATAPSTLRLFAASVLQPTALATLAFVQSLGASVQRYTPGFMLMPYVEAQIMREGHELTTSEVNARLTLPWKIDLALALVISAGLAPMGQLLFTAIGRPQFVGYAIFLALVVLPIPTATMYRSGEVAAVLAERYGAMFRGAFVSVIAFCIVTQANRIGIVALLLLPVIDNCLKCILIGRSLEDSAVRPFTNWRSVLLLFSAGAASALLCGTMVHQSFGYSVILSLLAAALMSGLIVALRLFSRSELLMLVSILPPNVAGSARTWLAR
ncbi:hypothetical protein KZ810_16530 [Sphingomonas sp. RHCKR47]|uniref:hypothetical protein n=1 Tax=Sphingomonas citricola TaxID=2862498 RepID=UPI001CA5D740|nr:hypothetical protein [Sphingomonas citricola]MBW6525104.1 hypothetical protein [Sphingomonas citricola]